MLGGWEPGSLPQQQGMCIVHMQMCSVQYDALRVPPLKKNHRLRHFCALSFAVGVCETVAALVREGVDPNSKKKKRI